MKDLQIKLARHMELVSNLQQVKAKEMALRKELAAYFLKSRHVGTHNFSEEGYAVKAIKKNVTSLDSDMLSQMYDDFSNEERGCINFQPKLVMKEYKRLAEDEREYLDMCIMVKPGAPGLIVTKIED